jgi:Thioredoxin-like
MQHRKWVMIACGIGLSHIFITGLMGADEPKAGPVSPRTQPQELGTIQWHRGFDAAAAASKQSGKPLLVLFQEVPGCSTCKSYGDRVLSHPLIRDAVESLFVPVAIYNNIAGDDKRVLKKFNEPEWNNPVVRIMQHDRTELASRVAGDYSPAGLVSAMVQSLQKSKHPIPAYLQLLNDELSARQRGLERATLAMHCFWEGEGKLGSLDGVIETMPGFVQGKEVVEVWFDAKHVSYAKLVAEAGKMQCAGTIFSRSDKQDRHAKSLGGVTTVRTDDEMRPDKEPKYYLSETPFRFIPMTELQAARVNSSISRGQDPRRLLSPRQLRLLDRVEARPKAIWQNLIGHDDLIQAFASAERVAANAD